jgi:hypothetical protein
MTAIDNAKHIGDRMPDGTVFAGISPDTDKPMYVTPADAPLSYRFKEAKEYASKLGAHGHQDWRVPTTSELNELFNNRAAIGGFNLTGSLSHRLVQVRIVRRLRCVGAAIQ